MPLLNLSNQPCNNASPHVQLWSAGHLSATNTNIHRNKEYYKWYKINRNVALTLVVGIGYGILPVKLSL